MSGPGGARSGSWHWLAQLSMCTDRGIPCAQPCVLRGPRRAPDHGRSVEFHRGGELLLTAGLDRRVRLFSVDGVK